jgi:iron(III) transport system substrate-binding protein
MKRNELRGSRRLFVSILALILLAHQSHAQSPNVQKQKEEAAQKGMIYLTKEEILAGAKREGKALVYPGHDEKTIPLLVNAFKQKYPFLKEVNFGFVSDIAPGQRELFDMIAGKASRDAFNLHQTFWSQYFKHDLLKKYDFKAMAQDGQLQIPSGMIDESGVVVWLATNIGVMLYNTKVVPPENAPTGWDSCVDPKWKGKFYLDTKPNEIVWLLTSWGEDAVVEYAKKLKANEPIFGSSRSGGITRLASGEFHLQCTVYYHTTQRVLKKDPTMPVRIVIPNPLPIALLEPDAIYARAENPHAGLLWLEFLASQQAQQISDSREPGRASFLVEGTLANRLAKGANVSICASSCRNQQEKLATRIATEAWGLPKVGANPSK